MNEAWDHLNSEYFWYFPSETSAAQILRNALCQPVSLSPVGFLFQSYLLDDGFHLHQTRSLTRSAIQRESADLHNQHKTLAWQKDTIVAQVRPGEMWQEWVQNASAWCFTERVPGFNRNFWNWSSVVANRQFSIRFSGRRKLSDLTRQRGCELSGKRA